MRRRPEQGISLIELLVAFTVFFTVAVTISDLLVSTVDAYGHGVRVAALDGDARRALDRMAEELMAARPGTFTPLPLAPYGASSITFQKAIGSGSGGAVFGPPMRFELAESPTDVWDGVDNDGDGWIDEADLIQVRNIGTSTESLEVLAHGITSLFHGEELNAVDDNGNGLIDEEGLSITLEGRVLTLRLSLGGRDPKGRSLVRTVETSVVLRN